MHTWSRTRHLVQLCLCIKLTFLDASNGTGRHSLGAESGPTCHPAPDTAVLWTLQKVTPAESIQRPQRRQGFGTSLCPPSLKAVHESVAPGPHPGLSAGTSLGRSPEMRYPPFVRLTDRRDFPGGPEGNHNHFHCTVTGLIPGASWHPLCLPEPLWGGSRPRPTPPLPSQLLSTGSPQPLTR